jgi:hypothetical protein
MNKTLDAVPSLKGHQQKPTYVEHDSRLLAVFIFPPPMQCALRQELKLAEISRLIAILFLLMSVESISCRIQKKILQYKKVLFQIGITICDSIVGVVANHFVVTQSCH